MNLPYEWRIGLRYTLTGRHDRFVSFVSLMSAAGIAIGVAALIVVLSVMGGFHKELRGRILGVASHLEALSFDDKGFADWRAVADDYLRHDEVLFAAPNVQKQGLFINGRQALGALVRGVEPALEAEVSGIRGFIEEGSLDDLRPGSFNIALGRQLAERLKVGVGGEVVLIAPSGQMTAAGFYPRRRRLSVAAIFSSGLYQFDQGLSYMHLRDARAVYQLDGATSVRLKVGDVMRAPALRRALEGARADAWLYDWTSSHSGLFRVIVLERRVMFVILTLIIAVAAFNIVAALVTMVRNKRGDIAILRAMGATSGGVARIFLLQGFFIGLAGTCMGVLAGYPLAINAGDIVFWLEGLFGQTFFPPAFYQLNKLPSIFSPHEALIVVGVALTLSLLATLYPAWYGARMKPADALRYEE